MTTHTHPEILADILELSKTTTSEIGDSEERLRADIYKIRDELKFDIAELSSRMHSQETAIGGLESKMDSQSGRMDSLEGKLNDVQEDVKDIKDFLMPPKP